MYMFNMTIYDVIYPFAVRTNETYVF